MPESGMLNILIETGTDFVLPFTVYDNNGNPLDLTGATVESQLREYAEAYDFFEFACMHNGSGGRITVTMPHETTAQIPFTHGVYDVKVTLADGTISHPLSGEASIKEGVTKSSDGSILFMLGINSFEDLPEVGNVDRLYFVYGDRKIYRWNGTNYVATSIGNGIEKIEFVEHVDDFSDKYRITYDDGTRFDYIVTSKGISSIAKIGSTGTVATGVVDQYRITFNNNSTYDYYVTNGRTFDVKGTHDSTQAYSYMDMVRSSGATYVAKQNVPTGTAITNTDYWLKILAPFTLGTVESVGYDADPEITVTGTPDAPVLNFKVPRGIPGNESIDDTAVEGDTDKVWSADKSMHEINLSTKYDTLTTLASEETWINGSWNTYGQIDTSNRRICTQDVLSFDHDIELQMLDPDYKYTVTYFRANGTSYYDRAIDQSNTKIYAGQKFALTIIKRDETGYSNMPLKYRFKLGVVSDARNNLNLLRREYDRFATKKTFEKMFRRGDRQNGIFDNTISWRIVTDILKFDIDIYIKLENSVYNCFTVNYYSSSTEDSYTDRQIERTEIIIKANQYFSITIIDKRGSQYPVSPEFAKNLYYIEGSTNYIQSFGDNDEYSRLCAVKKHFMLDYASTWDTDNNDNNLAIAHISDIHSDSKRFNYFIDYCKNNKLINKMICTGDFVIAPSQAQYTNIMNSITGKADDLIRVIGNHEKLGNNIACSDEDICTYLDITNTYYSMSLSTDIKLIVLDQYDTQEASNRNHDFHYSQDQIDWLVDELEDAITNNKYVMIAMHCCESLPVSNTKGFYQRNNPTYQLVQRYLYGRPVEDIINAFKNGTNITETYTYRDSEDTFSVNHTFSGNGKFIAYMCGHYHCDFIGYSSKYNDQLILNITCGALIPTGFATRNYGTQCSDLPRIEFTKSENAFNVYGIDLTNRLVKVARIGADMNDLMEDRKKAVFTF